MISDDLTHHIVDLQTQSNRKSRAAIYRNILINGEPLLVISENVDVK